MNQQTVTKLRQLNQKFYETVADSFAKTRQRPWVGWQQLLPDIQQLPDQNAFTVLDIGCGNGRFGQFLATFAPELSGNYLGVDHNQRLLDLAFLPSASSKLHFHYQKLDILADFLDSEQNEKYNLVVAFGVFHHIPSFDLRAKLLSAMAKRLKPTGLGIISTWNFLQVPALMKRAVVPKDLETNDYLLNWENEQTAERYCHYLDDEEIQKLFKISQLQIKKQFLADGKNQQLNRYLLFSPPKSP